MKKILFLTTTLYLFTMLYACQDEFCLNATTPNLLIDFYDANNATTKKEIAIIVWANNKDTIFNGTITENNLLSLPLDTQANSVIYHLSKQDELGNGEIEAITINYTTEDFFVSKACGFKSVFNNLSITASSNNWLVATELQTQTILNESETHVKILH